MISGYRQEFVSRFTTTSVERHCGANTYHASSDRAVARLHVWAIIGARVVATSSPVDDSEYTVPSAPTATSRAASPGTSASEICQLKPSGANTYSSARPIVPARLYWMAGPVASGGGAGKLERNHSTIISERMMVPTRSMKVRARSHSPSARLRRLGHLYSGSSSSSGW